MARKLFERQGIRTRGGALATGVVFVAYTDEAATVLADISATSGGSAISGSTFTVAAVAGLGPASFRIWGPTDDTAVLYLRCPADPSLGVQEIEAEPEASAAHPNLATHDALGLATDAELATHAAAADPHPTYETSAEAAAKVTTHTALPDAHHAQAHAAAHLPNAADALAWSASIHMAGTAASRPAAAAGNAGLLYFTTDTAVLWRSTGSAWVRVAYDLSTSLLGNAAYRETFNRWMARDSTAMLSTGVMHLTALPLYAGDVVTSLTFLSSAVPLTQGSNNDGHWWFALYDIGAANLLSQTADQTTGVWGANAFQTKALGTPQTITVTGIYYAAIMVNAGTGGAPAVPSLRSCATGSSGITNSAGALNLKVLAGTNGTGLTTTAPAGPLTVAANATGAYSIAT